MGAPCCGKPEFRRRAREARRARQARGGHEDAGGGLLRAWREMLADLSLDPSRALVALYVPSPGEPDVWPILRSLPRALLPVLARRDGGLRSDVAWALWRGDEPLERPNPRRPAQPRGALLGAAALRRADLIVAAAVSADRSGTRLGHGSGWYDRALPFARPGAPIVGAVFDEEVLPAGTLPREPHDVPVAGALTERGWVPLRG